jgi:hypothetical protein
MRHKLVTGTIRDPAAFIRGKIPKEQRSGWNEKPEEPELPSTGEILKNAAKSVLGNVAQAVKGEVRVSTEEAARRLEICSRCEFFRASDQRCSKCGCFMALKTYLKAEKCPTDKW